MNDESKLRLKGLFSSACTFALFVGLAVLLNDYYKVASPHTPVRVGINLQWYARFFLALSILPFLTFLLRLFTMPALRQLVPSKWTDPIASSAFGRWLLADQRIPRKRPARIVLLLATIASIMLVVLAIRRTGVIPDEMVDGTLYDAVSTIRGDAEPSEELTHVVRASFRSTSSDPVALAKDLTETIVALKEAGASAILTPDIDPLRSEINGISTSRTRINVLSVFGPEVRQARLSYHRALRATGIAVLYSMVGFFPRPVDSLATGSLPFGTFANFGTELWPGGSLVRIKLTPLSNDPLWKGIDDALVPLWKIHASAGNGEGGVTNDEFLMGNRAIPLTNGVLYSKDRLRSYRPMDIAILRGLPAPFAESVEDDKLRFYDWNAPRPTPATVPEHLNPQELAAVVRGKCVMITLSYDAYAATARAYAVMFQNVVEGKYVRRPLYGGVWAALIFLTIAALVSYFTRPLVATISILVLGLVALFGGSIMYDHWGVLIDIFPPLFAVGLASWSMPLVSYASHSDQ